MENICIKEEIILERNQLNSYQDVHLFFYTYLDGELHLLLHKKEVVPGEKEENYKEFYTEIFPSDELPTFAMARLQATTYRGLFSVKNLEKMSQSSEFNLSNDDLDPTDEFKWYKIWQNENFQEWLDFISENHIQYDTIHGKMIYFIEFPVEGGKQFIEKLNKQLEVLKYPYRFSFIKYTEVDDLTSIDEKTLNLIKKFNFHQFIQDTIQMFKEDRVDYYIILACKKQGNKRDQAGFFHFPALLRGMYRKNNEKWLYMLASGDLPSDELLERAKAIIMPGSELSIYQDEGFLRKTEVWLKETLINYPKLKFLGICFGMQLLVNALGGKVENMGEGVFVRCGEKLEIADDFWKFDFVKKSGVEKVESLVVRQAHGDHVTKLPEDEVIKVNNYASSESCKNEMLVSDDERIFCFQGHPEYATDFSISRAAHWICIRSKMEPTDENLIMMKEKWMSEEKYEKLHSRELRTLCHSFLKN